jgi:polar amino acid transport system substrate-binding protein
MPRALTLLSLLAFLVATSSRAIDLAEVKSRGGLRVLVVGVRSGDEFFAPAGAQPGFDREVLAGFASLQRVRLEVVPVAGWDVLIPELLAGRGDLIAGRFTVTESRKKLIAFTSEVFPTRNVVLTRRHRVVRTIAELREEKVGTVKGTSVAEAVAAAGVPPAHVDGSVPSGALPDALKSGQVSAVVLGVENAISAQRADPALQLGLFVGPPTSLAYGVRKGDAELLKALDEYIENLRRTPTWSRLIVKYFGESAPDVLKKARTESTTP